MEKVVLLKTQLVEAARLGKSEEFRFKRLAVILLDNFVEIQLSALIKEKFSWDGAFIFQEKKYKQRDRKKILNYYDELLKTCVKESIINEQELFLLSFCHDIRNNLYHKIDEEELLVNVALRILKEIITNRQPEWKTARRFTSFSSKSFDPYGSSKKKGLLPGGNSEEDWRYFLNKYFDFIDKRKASSSSLLSKSLILKIKATRLNYSFIKNEFHIFFPYAVDWEFNDYLLHYSCKNVNHEKIQEIKEQKDKEIRQRNYNDLFDEYEKHWQFKKYERLNKIELKAKEMLKSDTYNSLEKYISLRTETNMIYEAIGRAASELDAEIQYEIDIARGK